MSERSFPITQIPFSFYGSWLSVSPVVGQHAVSDDLHLVSHRNGMHPVLSLAPVRDGVRADARVTSDPAELSWCDGADSASLAFETADTVRLRGAGLGLRIAAYGEELTPFSGSYLFREPLDGSFVFTSYETGHRYRITVLSGRAEASGLEALGAAPRVIVLSGADGARWEVAIEEFAGGRRPYVATRGFDTVVGQAESRYRDFAQAIKARDSPVHPAAGHAAYVLWSAAVQPAGFVTRPSILMSKHWMDKVWSWDHCFNALAVAPGLPELAWDQFMTMFDHQDASGALPDSVTHAEVLYNFVKPPIHGWALTELRRRLPEPLTAKQLAEAYARLGLWTGFWLSLRRAPERRLCYYQHGNDSGWDNATTFGSRRVLESPDLAAFLVLQLQCLAELAEEMRYDDDALRWRREAQQMLDALLAELWDGAQFVARSPFDGSPAASQSLLELVPVILGRQLPADIAQILVGRVAEHLATAGLATEPPSSPLYQADGYWSGPVWAPPTVLIEHGLRSLGAIELAEDVRDRFLRACERSGFAENFDAVTGEGLRDRAYTWTASAYLLLTGSPGDGAVDAGM